MSGMPKDVKRSLEESGVKFDENGNMIENDPIIKPEEDIEEEIETQDEDETLEEDDDLESDDDDNEDEDEETDEVDSDEDGDDEVEKAPKNVKKKPKLTKKEVKKALTPKEQTSRQTTPDNSQAILDQIAELQRSIASKKPEQKTQSTTSNSDNEHRLALEEIRQEAEKFKNMSMQRLASDLEREVDRRYSDTKGVRYREIIQSNEWDQYLNKRKYGVPLSKFYSDAINNSDWNTMLDFFDDFVKESIPDDIEEAPKTPKKKLEDLAVPENSKSTRKPKRKAKYDFDANAYSEKLNEFERGKINYTEFAEFEKKFEKALSNGRVKPAT